MTTSRVKDAFLDTIFNTYTPPPTHTHRPPDPPQVTQRRGQRDVKEDLLYPCCPTSLPDDSGPDGGPSLRPRPTSQAREDTPVHLHHPYVTPREVASFLARDPGRRVGRRPSPLCPASGPVGGQKGVGLMSRTQRHAVGGGRGRASEGDNVPGSLAGQGAPGVSGPVATSLGGRETGPGPTGGVGTLGRRGQG